MTVPHDTVRPSASYCSYLVRLWRDQPDSPWRASAQHVQTGESVRFTDLDSLCHYLMHYATEQCDAELAAPSPNGDQQASTVVGQLNLIPPASHP